MTRGSHGVRGISTGRRGLVALGQIGALLLGLLLASTLGIVRASASSGNKVTATTIVGGENHSLAVKANGTVWASGYNYSGSLGDGTNTDSNAPVAVVGPGGGGFLTGITSVAAGGDNSLALRSDGTVWAWGDNDNGEMGIGTTVSSNVPEQVLGPGSVGTLTGVVSIASGFDTAYALKADGTVWAWGENTSGQVGDGTTTGRTTPVQVVGPGGSGFLTGVTALAGGYFHALALKSDGTVWTWGSNSQGELGNGTKVNSPTPVQVVGSGGVGALGAVTAVAGGFGHSLALMSNGTADAWGAGGWGQLGDGATNDSATPVQVSGLIGADQISASGYTSMARTGSGVLGWGYNGSGQLGNNTTASSSTPVAVQSAGGAAFSSAVSEISEGDSHALALMPDGTLYGWGSDYYGQLGDGNNTIYGCQCDPTPVQSSIFSVAQPGGAQPPGAVSNVAATGGESSASVTWTPVTSTPPVTNYAVTLLDANATIVDEASVCSTCTSDSFVGLNDGQSYYFAIAAENVGGFGPEAYSNTVTPPAPTSTSAVPPVPPSPCPGTVAATAQLRPMGLAASRTHSFTTLASPLAPIGFTLPSASVAQPPSCDPNALVTSAQGANDLKYRGGDVETQTTVYLVFWEPTGDAPADPNYNQTVINFFRDLVLYERQNGGQSSPFFSLLEQYYQLSGGNQQHITGQVAFGGAVLDSSSPYPNGSSSACNPTVAAQTNERCVSDSDIANEADTASQTQNWPETTDTMFLVFTGQGAIVCDNTANTPDHCSPPSDSATGQFECGYHAAPSNPFHFHEVYGAVAYPIGPCNLKGATSFPNGGGLPNTDSAISIGSHEQFESISDPYGHGWCDDTGYNTVASVPLVVGGLTVDFQFCTGGEIGDKCEGVFGQRDSSGLGDLNLNGDEYLVQAEWSNRFPASSNAYDVNGNATVTVAPNKCSLS